MPTLTGGFMLSHGSRTIKLAGLSVSAKSCKWAASIEGEKIVYGTSKKPKGRTAGVFKPESFEVEIYKDDEALVNAALMAASLGKGVLFATFPIVVAAAELPAGTPRFDTIAGARVTKIEDSSSEGGENIVVKYSGTYLDILLSGIPAAFELPF